MRKLSLIVLVLLAAICIAVPAHAQSGGSGPPFNAQFGAGAPSVNCTPPSQGALARMLYWDTTNFVWYYCSATNTWTKFGTGTGTGTVGNCSTVGGWAYYAATGTTTSCLPFSVASLTALQGTDTKVLTAGTISGTSVLLCTDANGGATTSSCPSGSGTVNSGTAPQVAYYAANGTAVSSLGFSDLELIGGGRVTAIVQDGSGSTPATLMGLVALTGVGASFTSSVATATDPPYRTTTTAATTNSNVGISTDRTTYYSSTANPRIQFIGKSSATATVREFWCLSDQSVATLGGSATPAGNSACIRYDTSAGDTNFMCGSSAAGTWTFTSTGLAADTSVHTFTVLINGTSNVTCYIDGLHPTVVSTHVMAAGTILGWAESLTTLANSAVGLSYSSIRTRSTF